MQGDGNERDLIQKNEQRAPQMYGCQCVQPGGRTGGTRALVWLLQHCGSSRRGGSVVMDGCKLLKELEGRVTRMWECITEQQIGVMRTDNHWNRLSGEVVVSTLRNFQDLTR